jgi:hypothetical protein
MKLCAEGYENLIRGAKHPDGFVKVTLEGEPFGHTVAVDTTTGVGWRYMLDENGGIVVDLARDEALIERRFGSFRVEPLPR